MSVRFVTFEEKNRYYIGFGNAVQLKRPSNGASIL